MHLAKLKLRDFRNYRKLEAEFEPGFHVLLGSNAQGKTNLLEAVYILSTLRSFRGVGNSQIIHHERPAFFVGGITIGQTESDIRYYWAPKERKLMVNQKPIRRLADYLGTLRTVVFLHGRFATCQRLGQITKAFSRPIADSNTARLSGFASPIHGVTSITQRLTQGRYARYCSARKFHGRTHLNRQQIDDSPKRISRKTVTARSHWVSKNCFQT